MLRVWGQSFDTSHSWPSIVPGCSESRASSCASLLCPNSRDRGLSPNQTSNGPKSRIFNSPPARAGITVPLSMFLRILFAARSLSPRFFTICSFLCEQDGVIPCRMNRP